VLVLVDQSTEDVMATQLTNGRCIHWLGTHRRHRRGVAQAAVRTAPVVVLDVDPQDANKMVATDDQQMIQALPTDRPHPALRDGVGVGLTG
jgi:hypothetical protein